MSLSSAEIKKIAHLARLSLDETGLHGYERDLSNILDLIAQIERANTNDIEPMAHPLETSQRLRTDKITETNQRELFQSIAPKTEANLYLVPQVIE